MGGSNQGHEEGEACWGLTVEAFLCDGAFLRGSYYSVSAVGKQPTDCKSIQQLDFIAMSRCMVAEGSEVWIKVTKQVYQSSPFYSMHRTRARASCYQSQKLHKNMPAHHLRYLRAFYALGGSLQDQAR